MAEPIENVIKINEFWAVLVAIWALVGPVVIGLVSAIYTRRNEIANRKHAELREEEIYQRQRKNVNLDKEIEVRKRNIQEVKDVVIKFISFALECHNSMVVNSLKQIQLRETLDIESQLNEVPQIVEKHSQNTKKLNDVFSEFFLLSPTKDLSDKVAELLNFVSKTDFQQYQDLKNHQNISIKFQKLKSAILIEAQQFVAYEEQKILEDIRNN